MKKRYAVYYFIFINLIDMDVLGHVGSVVYNGYGYNLNIQKILYVCYYLILNAISNCLSGMAH